MGKSSGSSNQPVVVGYEYYLSMHQVLCQGPVDAILDVKTSDDVVISSTGLSEGRNDLNKIAGLDTIYGGPLKEGGIKGSILFLNDGAIGSTNGAAPVVNIPPGYVGEMPNYLSVTYPTAKASAVAWAAVSDADKRAAWTKQLTQYTPGTARLLPNSTSALSADMYEALQKVYAGEVVNPARVALGEVASNSNQVGDKGGWFNRNQMPAFRGVVSIVWEDLLYQSNSSRPKSWKYKVKRIPKPVGIDAGLSVINFQVKPRSNQGVQTPVTIGEATKFTFSSGVYSIDGVQLVGVVFDGGLISGFSKNSVPYLWNAGTSKFMSVAVAPAVSIELDPPLHSVVRNNSTFSPPVVPTAPTSTSADVSVDDANPACIILECLLNRQWGLGYGDLPGEHIDFVSFNTAAATLHADGFGVSCVWENGSSIEEFIATILAVIDAVLFVHPVTGKFTLKLLRAKDAPNPSFPRADESNIVEVRSFARSGVSELINQLTVEWTDAILGTVKSMTVHNPAAREIQQHTVATTKQYYCVTNDNLAITLASRDLALFSQSLASVELIVNRDAYAVMLGDVIDWDWADYGIGRTGLNDGSQSMSLRVVEIGYGLLEDNRITLKCIENIFKVGVTSFGVLQDAEFTHPMHLYEAKNARFSYVLSLPYRDLVAIRTDPNFSRIADPSPDSAIAAILAAAPNANHSQFEVWRANPGTGTDPITNPFTYSSFETSEFVPYAVSTGIISRSDTVIPLVGGIISRGADDLIGYHFLCVSPATSPNQGLEEFMILKAISDDRLSITVSRGCLDTVPKQFPPQAQLFFYGREVENYAINEEYTELAATQFSTLSLAGGKLQEKGTTLVADLPARWEKPYPPANIRVDTDNTRGGFMRIYWSHRDRELAVDHILNDTVKHISDDYIESDDEAGVPRVPGIYYAVRILKPNVTGVGEAIPAVVDVHRYVGIAQPNGTFSTERITYTEITSCWGLDRVVVAVKSVQGDLFSEWNYVEINPNTGTMYNTYYPQSFFGVFEPVVETIADHLVVTLSGGFNLDAGQSRLEFEGDTLKLSFDTNIKTYLASSKLLHSQTELDSWFKHYIIRFYDLEMVDANGDYMPLGKLRLKADLPANAEYVQITSDITDIVWLDNPSTGILKLKLKHLLPAGTTYTQFEGVLSDVVWAFSPDKYTQESFFNYPLHENALDRGGEPSPVLGFNIYVEDTAGNISKAHSVITLSNGDDYPIPLDVNGNRAKLTTITSSKGLSVKGNAPRDGIVAKFLDVMPSIQGIDATLTAAKVTYFIIIKSLVTNIAACPVYYFVGTTLNKTTPHIWDLTEAEILDPVTLKTYTFVTNQFVEKV